MELVRWDQVEGVNRVQSRINELFEDTFGRTRAQQSAATGVWYPPVEPDGTIIEVPIEGLGIHNFYLRLHIRISWEAR